eukprot:scaffold137552_cov40-Tisochrysis_lutea.AAC.2
MASLEERILRPDDSRMTLSTSIEDVSCEPTSSDRSACQPCSVDEMDESYCSLYRPRPRSLSGYRQEVRCFSVNVTDGRSEIEPYLTYQSCTQRESEFMGLARFEVKRRPPWFTPGGATARVICGKSVHNGAWTTLDATILANSRPCVCSGAHAAHLCIVFLSGPGEEATARPHPA